MKIRLIIATKDKKYVEKLLKGAEQRRDLVDPSVCTNYEKLNEMIRGSFCDVILMEPDALAYVDSGVTKLKILLWDQNQHMGSVFAEMPCIQKYQRISNILAQVISYYAQVAPENMGSEKGGRITAVWSPSGGVGKTSVALAYATRRASDGKRVTYLDLENFSSTDVLFEKPGNSITAAFEQIAGNMALQLQGLLTTDSNTGISYFGSPRNYDDVTSLTTEEVLMLCRTAAQEVDELVVDLNGVLDEKTRGVFELAWHILLVTDASRVSQAKLSQFMNQNNVFYTYKNKFVLVANKNASISDETQMTVLSLPYVRKEDPVAVYRELSANAFQ